MKLKSIFKKYMYIIFKNVCLHNLFLIKCVVKNLSNFLHYSVILKIKLMHNQLLPAFLCFSLNVRIYIFLNT